MTASLAIITGGSRGLGYETARQLGRLDYRLAIASKTAERLEAAAAKLKAEGFDIAARQVDVGSARSIAAFAKWAAKLGPVAVLVNAAGILPETSRAYSGKGATILGAGDREVVDTLTVNALGAWRMCKAIGPLIADGGRIVNVSSGMGALTDMGQNYFGYRASKAALNVLTRTLAHELRPRGIIVNSICPGWVKTDIGGPNATRSVEEGAAGIVWSATLESDGPTGGFFRDRQPIAW
jgi:NAD(P)-dependent dehydrogenase (short-subunit alcohol dehydrogenase family)